MAAAVTLLSIPLLMLAQLAIQQLPYPRTVPGQPGPARRGAALHRTCPATQAEADAAVEAVLRRAHCCADARQPELLRRRRVVTKFLSAATEHLRHVSPVFANATLMFAGSAFEGTSASLDTDYDAFVLLPPVPLRITAAENGLFAVRLQADALRRFPELRPLVDEEGRLSAFRFKQWAFAQLERALRMAAGERVDLQPAVYQSSGACGVNLTAPQPAVYRSRGACGVNLTAPQSAGPMQVDYGALLSAPDSSQLRAGSLQPCGLQLGAQVHAGWFLYSEQDVTSGVETRTASERRFLGNAQRLERRLLAAAPTLRSAYRLAKAVSRRRRWHDTYHLESFVIKQAGFWALAKECTLLAGPAEGGRLLPALIHILTRLAAALRAGQLPEFFVRPGHNTLRQLAGRPPGALLLADEIDDVISTLRSGTADSVARLFPA